MNECGHGVSLMAWCDDCDHALTEALGGRDERN
jgi:hypothetical protein